MTMTPDTLIDIAIEPALDLLPDIEAVKAAGGAQAWFDAEMSAESASTSDGKQ